MNMKMYYMSLVESSIMFGGGQSSEAWLNLLTPFPQTACNADNICLLLVQGRKSCIWYSGQPSNFVHNSIHLIFSKVYGIVDKFGGLARISNGVSYFFWVARLPSIRRGPYSIWQVILWVWTWNAPTAKVISSMNRMASGSLSTRARL